MYTVNPDKSIAELVVERSNRTRLFEHLGIDFCCGGKKTLAQVCADKGLDVNTVVQTMSAFEAMGPAAAGTDSTDWSRAGLTALCDHIEQTHHAFLKVELPRTAMLLAKVADVHSERHPELHEVDEVFNGLKTELESHLHKEEQVLFPAIRRLEAAGHGLPSLQAPVHQMEAEHDSAGAALERLRKLTHNYTVPADACGSFVAVYEALTEIERDLHQHIHKENNILFPRAIALQSN